MSVHQMFRRVPVPAQTQQRGQPYIIPAPTRGIILSENLTFMQPGGCMISDNWVPTMRGVKLRGGCMRWCDLHALDATVPPVPDPLRKPVVSGFEYVSAIASRMFAANINTLYDITLSVPVVVKSGQTSGNYASAQFANAAGDWLIAVNDRGDYPLRFNGTTWEVLDYALGTPPPNLITGPPGSAVEHGKNLVYVWKYSNRLFFIEYNSMNAWYLDVNSVGGALKQVPLSGAAARGGKLIFGATWSIDAGDGTDDKCVFYTTEGEALVFSGISPESAETWHQDGRYTVSKPMGMNAHMPIGGDLLIATYDGIIPLSQAITKTAEQLDLVAVTRNIKPLWRTEVADKNDHPWTMKKWDEYGGTFVTTPGGPPGARSCLVANSATNAWCRFVGYDAMCFMYFRGNLFFGTQDGTIMQADRTGLDDGKPYTAVLVGGWEMFQTPPATVVWRQARASFTSSSGEPFQPQLAACTDYQIRLPPAPSAGPDPGAEDVWDQGLWGPDMGPPPPPVPTPEEKELYAQWDQPSALLDPIVRNTGWVSIGETGFSHAPIVQVTVSQKGKPRVELISISCMHERVGANV